MEPYMGQLVRNCVCLTGKYPIIADVLIKFSGRPSGNEVHDITSETCPLCAACLLLRAFLLEKQCFVPVIRESTDGFTGRRNQGRQGLSLIIRPKSNCLAGYHHRDPKPCQLANHAWWSSHILWPF